MVEMANIAQFEIVERVTEDRAGSEKSVCKITDGRAFFAAKLIRKVNENGTVIPDREAVAKKEYEAYLRFRRSELGVYTPAPAFLIKDRNDQVMGLAIEWIRGKLLSQFCPKKPLRTEDIDLLENALLLSRKKGLIPHPDVYTESNLLLSTEGRLFFAECEVVEGERAESFFDRTISDDMNYLRQEYCNV
ncbi:hypothetical protein GYA49_02130 [Candidatus Beckwithbacteria bacterium]|nr:hypothetical protein [Candidatus Beckwithbacteria bacterium]